MSTDIENRTPIIFYTHNARCNDDELRLLLTNFEMTLQYVANFKNTVFRFDFKNSMPPHNLLFPFSLTMKRHRVDSQFQWHGTFKHHSGLKQLQLMGILL